MREDHEVREVRVSMSVSVDPSWTNAELAGELITIFDESLHEDSQVWVKSVKVDG